MEYEIMSFKIYMMMKLYIWTIRKDKIKSYGMEVSNWEISHLDIEYLRSFFKDVW